MARVRRATADDILRIVGMVEALTAAINGPIPVDRGWTAATLARLIDGDDGAVFVSDGGFIAGALQPTVISPRIVAKELGWFASDRSGMALLRAFEAWAIDAGAALIQISTGAVGPDLRRMGYRMAEQAWVK